jgi:hypothetical protein
VRRRRRRSRSSLGRRRDISCSPGAHQTIVDSQDENENASENIKVQVNNKVDLDYDCAPSGTRTPNLLVKSRIPEVSSGVE